MLPLHSVRNHPAPSAPPKPFVVDPYQYLQVRRDATHSEIRHAYRRLALWHHPGRRRQRGAAATATTTTTTTVEERERQCQVFEILAACFETLMDKDARRRCDALLKEFELQGMYGNNLPHGDVRVGGRPVRRVVGRLLTSDHNDDSSSGRVLTTMPSLTEASLDSSSQEEDTCTLDENSFAVESLVLGDEEEFGTAREESITLFESCRLDKQNETDLVGTARGEETQPSDTRVAVDTSPEPCVRSVSTENIQAECAFRPCCAAVSNSSRRRLQPLRILDCGQASSDADDYNDHDHDEDEVVSFADSVDSFNKSSRIRNSTSTTDGPPDIHYTRVDTNRLFGGPLQLLFRARRWKPFTEPAMVYRKAFGSHSPFDMHSTTPTTMSNSLSQQSPSKTSLLTLQLVHPQPAVMLSSEHLEDGTTIHRTVRMLHQRKITRTEVIQRDPLTGKKRCQVTVTSEDTNKPQDLQQQKQGQRNQSRCIAWEVCFCMGGLDVNEQSGTPPPLSCSWSSQRSQGDDSIQHRKKSFKDDCADNDEENEHGFSFWSLTKSWQCCLPSCV